MKSVFESSVNKKKYFILGCIFFFLGIAINKWTLEPIIELVYHRQFDDIRLKALYTL